MREALAAGAVGAVAGTRFLLSNESRAHPEYQRRLRDASETVLTQFFGASWPDAPHRVVPNAATARWLRGDPNGPTAIRLLNRALAPLASRLPMRVVGQAAALQRPGLPIFGPESPLVGDASRLVDASPLYAGVSVRRIRDMRPAAELTREIAG